MKVVLAVHGLPPEHTGGTEHAVHALARELAALGHELLVVAGSDLPGDRGWREDAAGDGTVRVLRRRRSDPHYGHWHRRHSPEVSRAFAELLERERPDLVHVHHWLRLSDDLVRCAARRSIPTVTTLHDYGSSCPIIHRVPMATRRFCRVSPSADPCSACTTAHYLATPWVDEAAAADHYGRWLQASRAELAASSVLVCLSRDHAETIAVVFSLDEVPVHVPPALAWPPARRAPRGPGPELVLGCWGSLHELKGADIVVEAVRLALADGAAVRLHLAGQSVDPPFEARVRQLVLGLPVHLHGRFGRLEDHAVGDVDAFVSGSRAHETWGLVADEAHARGIPLILPAAGAFPERFRDCGSAQLYEPCSPSALADVLVRLQRDDALRARFFAPITDSLPNTPAATARRYVDLYALALERGAPPTAADEPAEVRRQSAWHEAWSRGFAQHYGRGAR